MDKAESLLVTVDAFHHQNLGLLHGNESDRVCTFCSKTIPQLEGVISDGYLYLQKAIPKKEVSE